MLPFNRYLLVLFCGSFFLGSCADDSDKLSVLERQAVDTLYSQRVKLLRPELDSLCDLHYDSLVQYTADSLIKARLAEIDRIMNRQ